MKPPQLLINLFRITNSNPTVKYEKKGEKKSGNKGKEEKEIEPPAIAEGHITDKT
jgi:hypothetical protein